MIHRPTLVLYKTLRSFEWNGRVLSTFERLVLPEPEGERLVQAGYLVRIHNGTVLDDRLPIITR